MAQKRMFSNIITDTDRFLDMPASSQNLYFHLNMHADDDGFVDSPKRIMRNVGAGNDDMNVLLSKKFVLNFDSGLILIKDWKIHNVIRKDMYKPTVYTEEKSQIIVDDTKSYQFRNEYVPQNRLDKNRLDKNRLDKDREETIFHFVENEFGRLLSPMEIETIGIMIKENNPDLVKEAIKRTKLQGKTNLNYASGILRNWRDDNITTIEQIETKEKSRKSKQEEVSEYDTW
ncbi:TPA: DnaD domain protein [Streptococcus agalactiae]|uniref:DnaD domain-containing protein n=2 Tax=Streptococcus agalactiae TaxID=1311 RepID=UPI00030AB9EA|nr:DnaD domain protein [Streptococcus agalactiae]EMA8744250.1 DnaD domain protein [Streptococcus agalactiae]EPV90178.1 DNA replication protein [Streptococcus agalactiae FSL S3-586]KLK68337.1 DNA replication protein [Streptococcus agalactiae]KLK71420.1 DNA replication protein [Streptococcus agalactiae]MCQ3827093.1 DnaD domain protein [Streptococcus agalactiae]